MKKLLIVLFVALSLITVRPVEAVTRVEIPGGIYAEACPDGSYSALILNSHVQTGSVNHVRPSIALPGENVLFLRSSCDATGRLCGTGHQSGKAWVYDGSMWVSQGIAFGNNACLFDSAGNVQFVRGPGEPSGSQGLRYVSGNHIVYAFETYADPVRQIFEYTDRTPFTVGQGPENGCRVLTPQARVLESGDCRFVHYNKDGALNAVGISKLGEGKAVIQWLTDAEMLSLPLVDNPPPPPPPAQTPDDKAIVDSVNEKFPKLLQKNTHEYACAFTMAAAVTLKSKDENWGLLSKPAGQNGCDDAQLGRYAVDAIIYKTTQQVVDIISGAGDEVPARTTWSHQPKRPDNNWVEPPTSFEIPDDDPPPPPPPANCDACKARVTELEAKLVALEAELQRVREESNDMQQERDLVIGFLQEAQAEITRLNNRSCVVTGPGWVRSLFGIRCEIR